MRKQPMPATAVEMGVISLQWDGKHKRWIVTISSRNQSRTWVWWLHAETTAELDEGTGWLVIQAVKEALEAQLF